MIIVWACLLIGGCRSADPAEPDPAKSEPTESEAKNSPPKEGSGEEPSAEAKEAPREKPPSKKKADRERTKISKELGKLRKAYEDWLASKPKVDWKRPVTGIRIEKVGKESPHCEVHGLPMEKWRIVRVHEFTPADPAYYEEKAKRFPYCDEPDVTDPIRPNLMYSDQYICKKCCDERDKFLGLK
jgi:hypothetical protein